MVCAAAKAAESATVKADDPEESAVAAISRGAMLIHNQPTAASLRGFKSQLRGEGAKGVNDGRKGGVLLPDPDAPLEKNPVEVVKFTPDPAPALSVTIRYYTLKKQNRHIGCRAGRAARPADAARPSNSESRLPLDPPYRYETAPWSPAAVCLESL